MNRATWNGAVLAESDRTVVVEGNHDVPAEDVHGQYVRDSTTHTRRPWKGVASYDGVVVAGKENPDAAWYYPEPSLAAAGIAGRIAFWHGVRVERVGAGGELRNESRLARLLRRGGRSTELKRGQMLHVVRWRRREESER